MLFGLLSVFGLFYRVQLVKLFGIVHAKSRVVLLCHNSKHHGEKLNEGIQASHKAFPYVQYYTRDSSEG